MYCSILNVSFYLSYCYFYFSMKIKNMFLFHFLTIGCYYRRIREDKPNQSKTCELHYIINENIMKTKYKMEVIVPQIIWLERYLCVQSHKANRCIFQIATSYEKLLLMS